MLEHLAEIFEDPNRKENVRQEYEQLKQKPKEEFADFIAEYSRLAEEAEIPVEDCKQGLYRKLDTATQMNINFKDNPPPVRGSSGGQGGTDKGKDKTKSPGSSTASGTPRPQIDTAERIALLKNGQCFYCRGKGYMAKDCPEKKTPAVATAGNTPAAVTSAPDPRLVEIEAKQPAKD
ncbi:unnamed protein product [Penicillium pancosmium]